MMKSSPEITTEPCLIQSAKVSFGQIKHGSVVMVPAAAAVWCRSCAAPETGADQRA